MKKIGQLILGGVLALGVLCTLFGCNPSINMPTGNENDDQIRNVYAMYTSSMTAAGKTPASYETWLASIRGVDGIDGKDGSDGKDGVTPIIGANGNWWIGETDTGVKAQGEKGEKGETGAQGARGEQGIQGEKGDQGEQGIQGEKGDQGEQGIQGEKGDQGEQGIQGEKGDTGAQGVGIVGAYIDSYRHLILQLSNGTEIDAGCLGSIIPNEKFTVEFKDWDGSTIVTYGDVPAGSSITPPADPERMGYNFIGWDAETDCVDRDMTVTAQYEMKIFTDVYGVDAQIDPVEKKMTLSFGFAQSPTDTVPVAAFELRIRYSDSFRVESIVNGNGVASADHPDDGYIAVNYFNLTGQVISETFTYLTVEFDISDCQTGDRVYVDPLNIANNFGQNITSFVVIDTEYIYVEE